MINGTHAILYAEDAEAARTFLREVLELPYVNVHDGWLIFKLPPAEVGIHPTGAPVAAGEGPSSGHHEVYLMCDDIARTVSELTAKGVEFAGPIEQAGFGRLVRLRVPGAGDLGLYEPRHATAYDLEG
ncbi:MAG TPA: VOC family protein [Acidimicrobiales bacterium]|nr:VOC family protein [Acidimicrobiales bacterium]